MIYCAHKPRYSFRNCDLMAYAVANCTNRIKSIFDGEFRLDKRLGYAVRTSLILRFSLKI